MSEVELTSTNTGEFQIKGALDSETVPALWRELSGVVSAINGSELTLDLALIETVDTAGVACLVNFSLRCQKRKVSVELKNVPDSIYKLAKISDVDSILALQ